MKNFAVVLSLVIGAWVLGPTPEAHAWSWGSWGGGDYHHGGDGDGHSVPELDPSAAGGAMVLLLGGVAYIASRRRKDDLV
jgi:hypothetical protein